MEASEITYDAEPIEVKMTSREVQFAQTRARLDQDAHPKTGWHVVDSSDLSVSETANQILEITNTKRSLQ